MEYSTRRKLKEAARPGLDVGLLLLRFGLFGIPRLLATTAFLAAAFGPCRSAGLLVRDLVYIARAEPYVEGGIATELLSRELS